MLYKPFAVLDFFTFLILIKCVIWTIFQNSVISIFVFYFKTTITNIKQFILLIRNENLLISLNELSGQALKWRK